METIVTCAISRLLPSEKRGGISRLPLSRGSYSRGSHSQRVVTTLCRISKLFCKGVVQCRNKGLTAKKDCQALLIQWASATDMGAKDLHGDYPGYMRSVHLQDNRISFGLG